MKKPLPGFLILLLGFLVLSGCESCITSGALAKSAATTATDDFHARFNREDYSGIYATASESLRREASEEQLTKLLTAIHKKLGAVKGSKQTLWKVFVGTGGTQVTLDYETDFEGGQAREDFVWLVGGAQARLLGYHINSNALVEK
jgi:hypothetical protein